MYANDTQLYISFTTSDSRHTLQHLSAILDQVYLWFCSNLLAVNPSKTEYLLIGTAQQKSKISDLSLYFQNLALKPSESARNLGIMFDSSLNIKSNISSICRSSFFQIR